MDTTPTGENFGFEELSSSDVIGAPPMRETSGQTASPTTEDLIGDFSEPENYAEQQPTPTECPNRFGEPLTLGSVDLSSDANKLLLDAAVGDTNAASDSLVADFDPIQPAQDPAPESEEEFESTRDPSPEPIREPTPEPIGQPIREPTPEPIREPTPEPIGQPTSELIGEPTPVPIGEPTPEPIREPTTEPIREPTQEPIQELVSTPKTSLPTSDLGAAEIEQPKPVELPKPAVAPSRTSPKADSNPLNMLDSRVLELLLWRKPIVTGVVFAVMFSIMIALTCCSVLSVASYSLLLTLFVALGARLYKFVMAKVHNGDDEHPFKRLLDADITLPQERAEQILADTLEVFNRNSPFLRDLILANDLVASIKFGLILYASTYIGAWFYAHTLLILAVVAAFTLPKIYEVNRAKIDQTIEVLHAKFDDSYKQLQDKIPFLKSKQH